VILLITAVVCVCLSPFVYQYITYEGDISDDDVGGDRTYYYDLVEYTDRIYVHKDGSGTTGESWETAYSTINAAYAATSSDLDNKTLIFVGLGTFDVNIAGQLDITKNVNIIGSGREGTTFMNSHISADFVFSVSRYFKIEHCEVFYNQSCGGINVQDTSDSHLIHINFMTEVNHTGTPEALYLDGGGHGEFEDLHFDGLNTTSTAINISNSDHNTFWDIEVYEYNNTGIHICNNSNNNLFKDIHIFETDIGLNIDSGYNQHFMDLMFFGCATNVDDEIGNSYWYDIITDVEEAITAPNDLTGVVVNTDALGDTYGIDTLIYDASASDRPYYIVAMMFEPNVKERYGLRLTDDGGTTYFYETVIEAKNIDEVNRLTIEFPRVFNAHSQIHCSVMSESGGDHMDNWLEIVLI